MDDDKALVLLRPQVLAKISDLRVDNGFAPLVIPPKDKLIWKPDYTSGTLDRCIDVDFTEVREEQDRGQILPMRDEYGKKSLSRFEVLRKKNRELFSIQARIDREIRFDEVGGIQRWGRDMYNELRGRLGLKIRTLEDLFEEEQKKVGEMHGLLTRLYELCNQHYDSLVSFRERGNSRMEDIVAQRPGRVQAIQDSKYAFDDAMRDWSRLDPGRPEYYRAREMAAKRRDAATYAVHQLTINDERNQLTNMFLVRIDTAAQILMNGKNTVERLGARYEIAKEFLQAWPALVTIRNLYKYVGTVREMGQALNMAFTQARQIEAAFENPHLTARVYHEMPALGKGEGMAGITDHLNTQLYLCGSGRKKGGR
jgi:hypothetical protein